MAHHAIHEAAIDADAEALRRELGEGVSPNLEWGGLIPLHHLCARTNDKDADNLLACFNILVAAGANVNAVDYDGRSAIHIAAAEVQN